MLPLWFRVCEIVFILYQIRGEVDLASDRLSGNLVLRRSSHVECFLFLLHDVSVVREYRQVSVGVVARIGVIEMSMLHLCSCCNGLLIRVAVV
jgi:hypothetical protein